MRHKLLLLLGLGSAWGWGQSSRYQSGLLRDQSESSGPVLQQRVAEEQFFKREFGSLDPRFEWRKTQTLADKTHIHNWYQAYFDGLPVMDAILKTHFNRRGFFQYATSGLKAPVQLSSLPPEQRQERMVGSRNFLRNQLDRLYGKFEGVVVPTLSVFQGDQGPRYVYDTRVTWGPKGVFRQLIVDYYTNEILEERRVIRGVDVPGVKVYLSSPLTKTAGTFDTVTVTDLDSATTLQNSLLHVRREELVMTAPTLTEVNPSTDHTAVMNFFEDPSKAQDPDPSSPPVIELCSGTCPNQDFDSVNVYYHLNSYRQQLDDNFSTLGASTAVTSALADPLEVIVNSLSVDLSGEGDTTDETNNAAYISTPCREGVGAPVFDRCLIFLRPDDITTSSCTGSPATISFYHLGREANVVVHEYQHYITDRLTGMIPGTLTKANVGDALHEGYSDYFGASEVMRITGDTAGTTIGASAFRNCPLLIRDVSTVRIYENGVEEEDPHTSGLSWASGLWALRDSLGEGNTDLLVLKSLFFIPTQPGFLDAVESLVKADQALNGGANVGTIRSLFYDQIKFVGGQSGIFRDPANGIAELGLRSCLGTTAIAVNPSAWIFITVMWLVTTLAVGRRW